MKVSSLFNLITDSSDILDFFERVESPEQLVSRLERLKRQGAEELFACLIGLRATVQATLDDTFEMNAALGEPEDDASTLDDEIAGLSLDDSPAESKPEPEKQNPTVTPTAKDPNNVAPTGK